MLRWGGSAGRAGRRGFRARRDGKLSCFANDVWFMYFNNKGSVEITVEELADS